MVFPYQLENQSPFLHILLIYCPRLGTRQTTYLVTTNQYVRLLERYASRYVNIEEMKFPELADLLPIPSEA